MGLKEKLDTTKFRSLKFGGDTPGGGSSGQPFIRPVDLKLVDSGFNKFRLARFDDGLIRGGALGALNSSAADVIRISKFIASFPKGAAFITKQVGLQLSNPQLEIKGGGSSNQISNNRIYSVANTIAQVGVTAFGGHIMRHGYIRPVDDSNLYINAVSFNNKNSKNRLVSLKDTFKLGNTESVTATPDSSPALTISKYNGGPQSLYGIGSTIIKRFDNTELFPRNDNPRFVNKSINFRNLYSKIKVSPKSISSFGAYVDNTVISQNAIETLPQTYKDLKEEIGNRIWDTKVIKPKVSTIRSSKNGLIPKGALGDYDGSTYSKDSNGYPLNSADNGIPIKVGTPSTGGEYISSKEEFDIPYIKANQSQIQSISRTSQTLKVDFTKLYTGNRGSNRQAVVDNRFGVRSKYSYFERSESDVFEYVTFNPINPFTGATLGKIAFNAFIKSISADYSAAWSDFKYIGRSEHFYNYTGYTRKGSFSLQVPAYNRADLENATSRIEKFIKILGGAYTKRGILGGIITYIKVGKVTNLNNQACVIDSIRYSISDEVGWDIDKDALRPQVIDLSVSFTMLGLDAYLNAHDDTPPPPVPPDPDPEPPKPKKEGNGGSQVTSSYIPPPNIPNEPQRLDNAIYNQSVTNQNNALEADRRFRDYYFPKRTGAFDYGNGSSGGAGATDQDWNK